MDKGGRGGVGRRWSTKTLTDASSLFASLGPFQAKSLAGWLTSCALKRSNISVMSSTDCTAAAAGGDGASVAGWPSSITGTTGLLLALWPSTTGPGSLLNLHINDLRGNLKPNEAACPQAGVRGTRTFALRGMALYARTQRCNRQLVL